MKRIYKYIIIKDTDKYIEAKEELAHKVAKQILELFPPKIREDGKESSLNLDLYLATIEEGFIFNKLKNMYKKKKEVNKAIEEELNKLGEL